MLGNIFLRNYGCMKIENYEFVFRITYATNEFSKDNGSENESNNLDRFSRSPFGYRVTTSEKKYKFQIMSLLNILCISTN